MKNKSFTFRSSWFEAISTQPDNVRLSLIDAICRYAINGELPEGLDPVAQVAFTLIRAEIDAAPAKRKPAKTEQAVKTPEATDAQPAPTTANDDTFDADFNAVATRLKTDKNCCEALADRGCLRNIPMALKEFKRYIRDRQRTAEFAGGSMPPMELCEKMLAAIPDNAFSKKAYAAVFY